MKNKLIRATDWIFAYTLGILMFITLLVGIAYFVAFIIGGRGAEVICGFLQARILSPVYVIGIAMCFVGIFNMYLKGEHVFLLEIPSKEERNATKNR